MGGERPVDMTYGSTEYLHIAATASDALTGDPVTLTDPPRLAFLTDGSADPAAGDWVTAEWADGNARLLIGPGGHVLPVGWYRVWITFTAGAETPVQPSGWLHIT
jgi:hypothetical protein